MAFFRLSEDGCVFFLELTADAILLHFGLAAQLRQQARFGGTIIDLGDI